MTKAPRRRVTPDASTQLYTISQIAVLLSVSERTVRRWVSAVYDMSMSRTGPRRHLFTLAKVQEIAAAHARVYDMSMTSLRQDYSPDSELAEHVMKLSRQIDDIIERVIRLETDQYRTVRPRLVVPSVLPGTHAHIERLAAPVAPLDDSEHVYAPLPGTGRGNARWVNMRGGPGASWVKDWPDVKTWQSPADAIAAVRRHRGWEAWIPAY